MEEFRSNSHKSKEMVNVEQSEERHLAPVVREGSASIQKSNGFTKIARSIIAEDMQSVGKYIVSDIIVPAFKKSIDDIVSNGIHMLKFLMEVFINKALVL